MFSLSTLCFCVNNRLNTKKWNYKTIYHYVTGLIGKLCFVPWVYSQTSRDKLAGFSPMIRASHVKLVFALHVAEGRETPSQSMEEPLRILHPLVARTR
jgi:hypothetical protein